MKIVLWCASGVLILLSLLAAVTLFSSVAVAQNQPPQIAPLNNLVVDESGLVDVSLSATDAEDAMILANPRIVVLGSSTPAGFGVVADSAWVERLRKYLISLGKPYMLRNLAVHGHTTYHMLPTGSVTPNRPDPDPQKNITAALALNPNIIIVNLPSNDLALGYSTTETMANFAILKQQAEAAGVLFFVTTAQPRNLNWALRQELKNQAMQIINTYGDFAIPVFDDLAAADLTIRQSVSHGDGSHVNEAGHRLIYERVLQTVGPYLVPQVVSFALQTPLRFLNIVQTGNRSARLEVRPKFNDAGTHTVTVRATDIKGGVSTSTFTVSVTDRPPGYNGKWAASQVAGSITHNLNGGDTYQFYIYFPRNYDDDNNPKPVLFALHGNEGKANGLEQLIAPTTGAGSIARMASQGTDFPMVVISPKQKNTVGTQSVTSWHVEQLHLLVQHSLTAYNVDRDRLYFTGYSIGGHGVWEYAVKYPDFPAAIAPMAGWTNFAGFNARAGSNPCSIKHIPTWVFHGNPDNVVPYSESTQMQSLMNACTPIPSPLVRLTTITGVAHDNIRPVVYPNITGADNIYDWFLQFSKRDGVPPRFTLSPEITGITSSTIGWRAQINEPGRIIWGIYPATATTPTYVQLQNGAGAIQRGSVETNGNTVEQLIISNLNFGTAYRVFVAAQDTAPTLNASAVVAFSATTSTEGINWQLQRTVKVNFSNTTVPNLPDWTTINGDAINGTTTFALRDANGIAAGINLIGYHNTNNSSHWGTRDNNSTLLNGPMPDAVMRVTLATQNTMRFKLTGLNPNLRYSFTMHGARTLAGTGFTDRPLLTVYDFNGRQASLECLNNSKNTVSVEYVQPNANGEIDFSYWGNNTDRWGYINGLIINEFSGSASATPLPAIPMNLTASATGQTTITLSWNIANGATGYYVYRGTTSGFTPASNNRIASGVSNNSFNDTDLQAGTTYFYRVSAINANGESAVSAQVQATTQAIPVPPVAPANLSASATGQTTVALSWDAVGNSTGYHVYRSTISGFTPASGNRVASNIATNAFNDSNLQGSTTYFYVVTAVNANGESPASNQAQVTTEGTTVTTGLRGEYFANITLSGTPFTRTDANINFNWGFSSPMSGIPADQFSIRWTGRIRATTSEVYTFIANTDDGVRLWINNMLIVDRWVNKGPSDVSGVFTMTAGVWYDFRMEYYDNSGGAIARLDWSTPTIARVPIPTTALQLPGIVNPPSQAPPAPVNLTASATGQTTVALSWNAVSGATGYHVYRGTTSGFTPASGNRVASNVAANAFNDSNLQASTTYFYVVTAVNANGESAGSNQAQVTTQAVSLPPAAPVNLSASATGQTTVALSWNAVSGATGYHVYRGTTSGFTPASGNRVASNVAANAFNDSNLQASTTYFYVVTAVNANGESAGSNQAQATTQAVPLPPAAPVNLSASATGQTTVALSWNAVSGATGYHIYRSTTSGFTPVSGNRVASNVAANAFNDSNLQASTTYFYVVTAVNANGESAGSNQAQATTEGTTVTTGLRGEYFANMTLSGTPLTRTDATINFNWGYGSPMSGIPANQFSVRWTGRIRATTSEIYTFIANTDDGVRLWINNTLVIDRWVNKGASDVSANFTMTAGVWYDFRMEYYENSGGAVARLDWRTPTIARVTVPASAFQPPATAGAGTRLESEYIAPALSFDVYPNPAVEQVNILLDNVCDGDAELAIVNVLGQVMYRAVLTKGNRMLSVASSQLGRGTFIVIATRNNGERITKKLIVE